MKQLHNLGRFLFAIPLVIFGLNHFMNASMMQNYVPGFIPGAVFWVYLVGVALILAAVAIMIKKQVLLACNLLALMLLIFVATMHVPGFLAGGDYAATAMTMGLKDLMLAGGALVIGHFFDEKK